jgi:exosortase/archaeosortase family protein
MKTNSPFLQTIKSVFSALRYVIIFFILLFSFHYIYKWWAGSLDFYPIKHEVDFLFGQASKLLFNQSVWILKHVFSLDFTTEGQTIWVALQDGRSGYVEVSPGCTSLKQWMHWLFIMLLFPGPWKHKLWYIPLGIIIIHFVNIIRIVGLSLTLKPWADHFDFFHDYIFKTFFYFMIFVMWVLWVEIFVEKKKKPVPNAVDE